MKRILTAIIVTAIIITSVFHSEPIRVYADEAKVVTLGADLSKEQRATILNYLNVNENEVVIVEVNNKEEHEYLDGIATQQQIGTHTYSCSYIEPTHDGGIHIKTANINWVTCEMIRNALVTSGVNNCNIICVSPIEVSGTGALTGIFKAYGQATGEELDEEKVKIASEELITTMSLAEEIGQNEASAVIEEVKEEVIESKVSEEQVVELVDKYLSENNINLTDSQKESLVELMKKISTQEYNIDDIKKAYTDLAEKAKELKEKSEEALGLLDKITNWLSDLWAKISGTYAEKKKADEESAITEQLGILSQTNDAALGANTVTTVTEEQADTSNTAEQKNETEAEQSETGQNEVEQNEAEQNETGVMTSIKRFFNRLFSKDTAGDELKNIIDNNAEQQESTEQDKENEQSENKVDQSEKETGVLDSITYDNETEEDGSKSFSDLLNQ